MVCEADSNCIRWKEMALEEEEESKSFETPEDPAYAKHINLYKYIFIFVSF